VKKDFICIVCPAGCRLTAEKEDSGKISVSGNKCPKGSEYATKELSNPERIVTAVVKTDSEELPFLPVRTDKAISRELVNSLLKTIYSMNIKVPVRRGDVLIRDFHSSGVNVIFSRSLNK
jgi:CxxC motif-containing protein